MRRHRALTLSVAIAAIAVLVPIANAIGQTGSSGTFNGLKSGGYLNLHFPDSNTAATLTQYQADRTTVLAGPQSVTVTNSCGVSFGTPQLASFAANGTLPVGSETSGTKFVGLGVKGKNSNGTNCGRVEPGETLTVTLGNGLKTTDGQLANGALVATAAELDIDAKGNAVVRADLFNGGTTAVGFALLSTSAAGGDSGPDATSGDNFAYPINGGMPACSFDAQNRPIAPAPGKVCGSFGAFRSLTLSTSTQPSGTPSFALEGGRAGDPRSTAAAFPWDTQQLRASTADTVFKLQQSDGVLNCGDTKQGSGTDTFTRGLKNKDGSPCIVVAYDYSSKIDGDTKSVELLWDTGLQPAATFSLTQTWLPEDSTTLPDGRPIPTKSTQVEWDPDIGFITAPACTSTSLPTVYGKLASAISDSDTTIAITLGSGVTARNDDFSLEIGSEMLSIPAQTPSVSGGVATYTNVTRGVADTDAAAHDADAFVMTTPFPVVDVGNGPIVAKMCLASSSWVPTGIMGTNDLPQVQVTETLLAEGDMIGKH